MTSEPPLASRECADRACRGGRNGVRRSPFTRDVLLVPPASPAITLPSGYIRADVFSLPRGPHGDDWRPRPESSAGFLDPYADRRCRTPLPTAVTRLVQQQLVWSIHRWLM